MRPRLRRLAVPLACVLFVALGTAAAFALPGTGSGGVQVDGNGDNYIDLQPIIFTPEPTALSMFGLGLGLMVTARSRRRGR